jgi:hypothetical protein
MPSIRSKFVRIAKEEGVYRTLLGIYMISIFACFVTYMQMFPHAACRT